MKGATEVLREKISREILNGTNQREMIDKIVNDYWGLGLDTYSAYTARNLIWKVRKALKDEWKEEHKQLRDTQLARLLNIYHDAIIDHDRMNSLAALKEINKVTGLYEPEKVDMTVGGTVTIDFGTD